MRFVGGRYIAYLGIFFASIASTGCWTECEIICEHVANAESALAWHPDAPEALRAAQQASEENKCGC